MRIAFYIRLRGFTVMEVVQLSFKRLIIITRFLLLNGWACLDLSSSDKGFLLS